MKTNLTLFLVVILMLSLAVNWIQLKSAREQESWRTQDLERFQKEQSRKLVQIQARDSVISILLSDRKADSAKYALEQRGLKTRINALRAKVTGPAVVQDTIIVFQDSLIASISAERDTLYLTDNQALDSLSQSITDLHGLLQDQALRAAEAEGRLEKEKKKRFSVGIGAGYGFKGPDIQVGIQYSLWRF